MTTDNTFFNVPNVNEYRGTKFRMVFAKLPYLTYFCQGNMLPSIKSRPAPQENPYSTVYRHGDKMEYDNLEIKIIVDEDLAVWKETYRWMRGLYFPDDNDQNAEQRKKGLYSDATVIYLKNSNEPNGRIIYRNCHPIGLSALEFETSQYGEYATATVYFRYDTFEFESMSGDPLIGTV